ncbi:hypothetical protein EPO04_04080 [Patescibacteria group bacterium]|nr:MAG: hypothetical protein EPO04_04080 [Patescibacteria group bacterium]
MNSPENPTKPGVEQQLPSRPEGAKTVEDIVEALDHDRDKADRAALEHGPSRELAAALAAEIGTQVQLDQRVSQEQGITYAEWQKRSAEEARDDIDPLTLSMELADYAAGKGELSSRAQQELENRVDQINAELDELEDTGFSTQTIQRLRGADEPYDVTMIAERYRALSELRKGESQLPDSSEAAKGQQDQERQASKAEGDAFKAAYEAAGIEGELRGESGYTDSKGIELVVEAMREQGMSEGEMAGFARRLAAKYEQFLDSAKTIHADKSPQTQGMWAENQTWSTLNRDPVWQKIDSKIDQYGDTLAGMGSRISRDKVMSSFLIFALQANRR